MEQRPLRLGDIVDDYCPRERRITNHAIVAIVENSIRQTRCTTCDAEHVYKEAKMPRRRKPAGAAADDLAAGQLAPPRVAAAVDPPAEPVAGEDGGDAGSTVEPLAESVPEADGDVEAEVNEVVAAADGDDAPPDPTGESPNGSEPHDDAWPAHRRLIRATLPRVEGEPPPQRPIPEFTMHQRQTRGGQQFRNGQGRQGANGQGRGGNRHGRPGQGGGKGQGQGGRPGRRSGRNRGHNKRSR